MTERLKVVKSILTKLGIEKVKESGDELRMLCPFHLEKRPSFSLNWKTLKFFDFHNHKGGTIYDLIAFKLGCSKEEAKDQFNKTLPLLILENKKTSDIKQRKKSLKNFIRFYNTLDYNNKTINVLRKRFISKEVIEDYKIKYSPLMKRIVIPITDEKNKIAQFELRDVEKGSKKKVLYLPNISVHTMLFNLYRAKKYDSVILTEGALDCLSLVSRSFNSVASFGTYLSLEQKKLLLKHFRKVFLAFDPDEAGRNATKESFYSLKTFLKVVPLQLTCDPDELRKKEIIQLLGKGASDVHII